MGRRAFATPEEAEAAFYAAFAKRDLDGMMAVWAEGEHATCVHPLGGRLIGFESIRQSWRRIFEHSPKLEFRVGDARTLHAETMAVHTVFENIRVGDAQEFQPPVIATNVYRFIDNSWRMVLHHASPTPAVRRERPSTIH